MRRPASEGFTLIEVMVSLAILGLGLASLFTSQVGAIKIAQHARSTTVATLLARCKMGEIEERVLEEGIPYDTLSETDECCEDMEHEGYECDWSIERIVLPDQQLEDDEEGLLDAIDSAQGDGDEDALPDPNDIEDGDVTSMLGGGGAGGMLEMVTGMTMPIMKPIIEEQVRRANVTVKWNEGEKEMSFDLVQFLVSEVGAPVPNPAANQQQGSGSGSGSGGGSGTGSSAAAPGGGDPN